MNDKTRTVIHPKLYLRVEGKLQCVGVGTKVPVTGGTLAAGGLLARRTRDPKDEKVVEVGGKSKGKKASDDAVAEAVKAAEAKAAEALAAATKRAEEAEEAAKKEAARAEKAEAALLKTAQKPPAGK